MDKEAVDSDKSSVDLDLEGKTFTNIINCSFQQKSLLFSIASHCYSIYAIWKVVTFFLYIFVLIL